VAAAIGGLTVLLIVAVGVLAFLLFRDDDEPPATNLEAAQTELNNAQATIDAQSTILANAAATETATSIAAAEGEDEQPSEESTATEASGGSTGEDGSSGTPDSADSADSADSGADAQSTTDVADGAVAGADGPASGTAPSVEELQALLPAAGTVPAELDTEADSNLDQAAVVEALGGSRTAEQNLERWGWSGNVGRTYSPSDPTALAAGELDFFSVSLHGFADAASAAEALTYFSDVLISIDSSYEEAETGLIGDSARLLVSTDDAGGTNVALYVQQGNILYRIGGHGPEGGDAAGDVQTLAEAILPAQE
jgi:hypothetical protein